MDLISQKKIEGQLKRLLDSPKFMAAERLSLFLRYVVEQSLNGQSDRIKQYNIAVEALGYGEDFDPKTDSIIRIQARRLRRALDQYYSGRGIEDPIRIDIPKGGYVPVFLDNQKTSIVSDSSECPSPVPVEQTSPDVSHPSIAVFEFEHSNEKYENAFFARGLTSEILVSLTRFSGLSVLGPLTHTVDEPIDYYKIIHEYGARFVLQGWVRSYGSEIRITTDLTDALTSKKLWNKTFEYDLRKTSLFEIEDSVTGQITGTIADGTGIIFTKMLSETYHEHIKVSDVTLAVLKYNNAWMTLVPRDWEIAIAALNKALVTQPRNALILALLANIYYSDARDEMNLLPDSLSKMEDLIHEAVSLDPNLQVARYNLVVLNSFFGRRQKCIAEAKRTFSLNPNHSRILSGSAVALTCVGEYELGKEFIERAKGLNPHYPSWFHFIDYLIHFRNGQYDEAWEDVKKIHIKGLFYHELLRVAVLGKLCRTDEAKPYLHDLLACKPDFLKRGRETMKKLLALEEHVEMLWDGLCKAGIRKLE